MVDQTMSARVPPSLGDKGQGWVALQFVALGVLVIVGWWDRGGWPDRLHGLLAVVGATSLLCGVVVAVLAVTDLGSALTANPAPLPGATMRTDGVYGVVRHPIYAGLLQIAVGVALVTGPWTLVTALALAVVLDLKRRVEEGFLQQAYPDYSAYRERVRWALMPGLR
jgi:protein-S-isoprenylcysteine O-methyltransferase Ste14